MKYTDQQRVEKMTEVTEKLLDYLSMNHITAEDILAQESFIRGFDTKT